ncbi:MAG TPA: TraR/DksA C4-type zinc finger protein [Candidatus Omnitrophota bacterium]|nr:TraR/DksA C4-type zinc finger protein [Candidatus Omnitrophota bacterium]
MTPEEKEELKKEIETQIDSVKQDLERLKANDKPFVSDRAHGRMGRIDAIQNRDFRDRGMQSLEGKLHGLEKNLREIDSPDFGICEHCKGPIGDERRKALPETKICIKCAEKLS